MYKKIIVTKHMKHHGLFFAIDLLKLQKIEMEQRDSPKEFHVTFIFKD